MGFSRPVSECNRFQGRLSYLEKTLKWVPCLFSWRRYVHWTGSLTRKENRVKRPTWSYRVNELGFRVTGMLGQVSAGLRWGPKRIVIFLRMVVASFRWWNRGAMRRWRMCVILCTCAVFVTSVLQMCLVLFLASSERGVSLRMREAIPLLSCWCVAVNRCAAE